MLAFWPGFVYESHARQIVGARERLRAGRCCQLGPLSPRAAEYHMLSSQQMARAITSHEIRVVVYGRGAANRGIRWRPILLAAGYRPVERVRDATLFVYGDR